MQFALKDLWDAQLCKMGQSVELTLMLTPHAAARSASSSGGRMPPFHL